jgi:dTDP-4-amino-4,6-dideoxygalactose transaminase
LGFNYRMTDIQAAIGREQLQRVPEIVRVRRALVDRYRALLADVPGLRLPREPEWARSNWQSFCVRLPDNRSQREVMQHMLDRGVATRRGIMCSHREVAYRECPTWRPMPASEAAQDHCIILPLYPQMTPDEQGRVAEALKECAAP